MAYFTGLLLLAVFAWAAVPAAAAAPDKPVVVFVPGFMGSDLYRGEEKLWMPEDPAEIQAALARLAIPQGPRAPEDGLTPRPMAGYDGFLEALGAAATVVSFPYDWRQSNLASAAALDRFLGEDPTARAAGSVILVAHSMGGLVAMLFAQDAEGRYANAGKVAKVVTIGTPFLGSVQSVAISLRGHGPLPLDRSRADRPQDPMLSFPGFYETMPSYLDGPGGLPCCSNRPRPGAAPRPLALWTWEGWSALDWEAGSYDPAAVRRELAGGAAEVRAAAEAWRREPPARLFAIAGLSDLKPRAPHDRGLAGTTSLAFVAFDGKLHTGSGGECGGASITCAYGDQVIAQYSATLGRASERVGAVGGTCSLRLGQGPDGPYYHDDIVDDPSVRATALAALAAESNAAGWCRQR